MKAEMRSKILENAAAGRKTVIGRYTYDVSRYDGRTIIRCLTEDIGREWIDSEGNQHDAWQPVREAQSAPHAGEVL